MTYEEALAKAKELVGKANDIVIVTHAKPTMDSMGGSLALMLGLISLGKKATVVCPDPVTVGLSGFVGVDRVVRDFGKKNFVISLDYVDGSIEKVSYNIEGKKFNLVVEHRPGFELFSPDKVQYAYQGVSADLVMSVDTLDVSDLGSVYEQQKDVINGKSIINIDFHGNNTNYGALNLVDPGASSTTELVAELLATLGVKLTADIATNLLNAIYDATNNFQNANVTSMAFEVASVCLKAGAKRFGIAESVRGGVAEPKVFVNNQPIPVAEPSHISTQIAEQPAVIKPQSEHVAEPKAQVMPQENKSPAQPPSDWLKPKIFKSSSLL
jgi:nanoRNase/pAp phosphatase (c-di-AMP/oligoRNAs hydrolase)